MLISKETNNKSKSYLVPGWNAGFELIKVELVNEGDGLLKALKFIFKALDSEDSQYPPVLFMNLPKWGNIAAKVQAAGDKVRNAPENADLTNEEVEVLAGKAMAEQAIFQRELAGWNIKQFEKCVDNFMFSFLQHRVAELTATWMPIFMNPDEKPDMYIESPDLGIFADAYSSYATEVARVINEEIQNSELGALRGKVFVHYAKVDRNGTEAWYLRMPPMEATTNSAVGFFPFMPSELIEPKWNLDTVSKYYPKIKLERPAATVAKPPVDAGTPETPVQKNEVEVLNFAE